MTGRSTAGPGQPSRTILLKFQYRKDAEMIAQLRTLVDSATPSPCGAQLNPQDNADHTLLNPDVGAWHSVVDLRQRVRTVSLVAVSGVLADRASHQK